MEKRSRRPHGSRAKKISVSVTEDDLALLTARAAEQHGGNISAALHDLVEGIRRQQALARLVDSFGGARASRAELDALRGEIAAASPPRRRRRHAA